MAETSSATTSNELPLAPSFVDPNPTAADDEADHIGKFQLSSIAHLSISSLHADDTISSIIKPIKSAQALYKANSDIIHSSIHAIASTTSLGFNLDNWLGILDNVVGGLDSLAKSSPFPFVGRKYIQTPRLSSIYLCGSYLVILLQPPYCSSKV